jgi:ketosteroid isomerase-like protein
MMRRVVCLLLALLPVACATTRPLAPPASVAEREILALERAWDEAEVRRDGAALDAILDDRFVLTFGGEPPMDKATVMKNVLASENPLPSTTTEERIIVDGDVAVSTSVTSFERVVDGKHVKMANRGTATFVYRDGRWRGLAVHMVRLP